MDHGFFLLQNSKTPWDRDMTRLWLSTFGSLGLCRPWDERYMSLEVSPKVSDHKLFHPNAGNSALVPFLGLWAHVIRTQRLKKSDLQKQGEKKVTNWIIGFVTCKKKTLKSIHVLEMFAPFWYIDMAFCVSFGWTVPHTNCHRPAFHQL